MHQLLRRTQDQTLLLDWLVMATKDQQVDMWIQWLEDMAHKDVWDLCEEVWDWAEQEFKLQLLALNQELMEALWEQSEVVARAVQTLDDDHQVLGTVLAMLVTFVPPAALPPTIAHLTCGRCWLPSYKPHHGPGRRPSATFISQETLPRPLPRVPCQPAPLSRPNVATCPSFMQVGSWSCLQ
ncbi:hypothetical protein Y1Q_0021501 [Alligator mississippiensis]|uniref:Uncharacterized protein n=1 Tax=Alligator mississippiensis TaxID=8496 RepID=A0A151P9Z6_ALLMI|nr:hypothetical protein Y1Q_0021501 [Alligator mississippiensis]